MNTRDFAAEARQRKVYALVRLIESDDSLDCYGDAEGVAAWLRKLTQSEWVRLGEAAKLKSAPSPTTQSLVIETFEKRVDVAGEAERLERAS